MNKRKTFQYLFIPHVNAPNTHRKITQKNLSTLARKNFICKNTKKKLFIDLGKRRALDFVVIFKLHYKLLKVTLTHNNIILKVYMCTGEI
jgi:hypothetical protein